MSSLVAAWRWPGQGVYRLLLAGLLALGATAARADPDFADAAAALRADAAVSLSVSLSGSGSGVVSSSSNGILCGFDCTESYAAATSVTLNAVPTVGSVFVGWSGACSGTSLSCSVNVAGATSVTANFGPASAAADNLKLTLSGSGSGTVSSLPSGIACGSDCSGAFAVGSIVILTATPAAGSSFAGWSGACSGSASTCLVTVSAATAVGAVFTGSTVSAAKLVNISTRAKVLTGDNVMIAGFIISGGPKRVLIKAEGPSMVSSGLAAAVLLSNPRLRLYSGQTVLACNDDWQQVDASCQAQLALESATAIQTSGRAPTNPLEAALLVTLEPGAYTAVVTGVAAATGIALVSVNDLDALGSAGRLVNISTRAYTPTGGDEQVIAGFIIQGGAKKVLIRGIGSSMGFAGVLSDPYATLFGGSGVLAQNDDWGSSTEVSIIDGLTQGAALQSKESALYRELTEGAYTVIMRGVAAPGIGLIAVDE